MHPLSQKVLQKLWNSSDGADLRESEKAPTVAFTSKSLPDYFCLPSAREKVLSQLLGCQSTKDKVDVARTELRAYLGLPGVMDLLQAWARDASPRKLSVDKLSNVVDACRIVAARIADESSAVSLRRLSARLLGDSKRAEALAIPLDVVMHGLEVDPLDVDQVFDRLGLLRFPLPMMIAGAVDVILVSGQGIRCPEPYIGIPPELVQGIRGEPKWILTIENLTVFHELANGNAGPVDGMLVYTAGHPGRQWLAAYGRVLRTLRVPVFHWGDTDAGGFGIAERLPPSARKPECASTCGAWVLIRRTKPIEISCRRPLPAS